MKPYDFLGEEIRKICCIITPMENNEMCHLREPIYNYRDGILPSRGPWKGHNEVHIKVIPRP